MKFSSPSKDLGHVWLGYIRMLGHLQLSAHLRTKFWKALRFWASPWHVTSVFLDIGTMTIESAPHPLSPTNIKTLFGQYINKIEDPYQHVNHSGCCSWVLIILTQACHVYYLSRYPISSQVSSKQSWSLLLIGYWKHWSSWSCCQFISVNHIVQFKIDLYILQ